MSWIFVFVVFTLFSQAGKADWITEPAFRHYTTHDGLSLNKVNRILADENGLLWLATDNGLNNFNGFSFRHFAVSQQRTLGVDDIELLSDNEMVLLTEDHRIFLFNRMNESIDEVRQTKQAPKWVTLFKDNHRHVFVADETGGVYEVSGKRLTLWGQLPSMDNNKFSIDGDMSLAKIDDVLLIGNRNGVHQWHLNKEVWEPYLLPQESLHQRFDINLLQFHHNKLWIGTLNSGLFSTGLTLASAAQLEFLPSRPTHWSGVLFDSLQRTWLTTSSSGMYWRPTNGVTFFQLKNFKNDPYSLSNNQILDITEDRFSTLWVATDRGLEKLDQPRMRLGHKRYNNSALGLDELDIRSMYELDDGRLFIGTINGLLLYSNAGVFLRKIRVDEKENSVFSIVQRNNSDQIWLGTEKGVFELNLSSFQIKPYAVTSKEKLSFVYALAIIDDDLWIGTAKDGVYRVELNSKSLTHFATDRDKLIQSNRINGFFVDTNGKEKPSLWILHEKGIETFNNNTGRFESQSFNIGFTPSVSSMIRVSASEYWLGTIGHGIIQVDHQFRHSKMLNKNFGLPNTYVNGLIKGQNKVWVSLDNFLVHFSADNKGSFSHMKVLSTDDGLQDIEFNLALVTKGNSGRLYFGGTNGVNVISPTDFSDLKQDAKAVIRFSKSNKFVFDEHRYFVSEDDEMTGSSAPETISKASDRVFNIHRSQLPLDVELMSVHSVMPKFNQIRYRVLGERADWVESNAGVVELRLSDLPVGDYRLQVQAKGYQTEWSKNNAELRFQIEPYFWESVWAKGLYFLLVVIALVMLYRFRVLHLIRKAEQLEQLVMKRTKTIEEQKEVIVQQLQQLESLSLSREYFFENVSHELKTPLTLTLGPTQVLLNKWKDSEDKTMVQMIHRNARRVLEMVEQLLSVSRLKSGLVSMNQVRIDVKSMMIRLEQDFSVLAKEKAIDLRCQFYPEVGELFFVRCDKDALEKVMNNLISNAIKYSPHSRQVDIELRLEEGWVVIALENSYDNLENIEQKSLFERFYRGDHQAKGSGIGLSLTKELVELNGGTIDCREPKPGRIRFTVKLEKDPTFSAAQADDLIIGDLFIDYINDEHLNDDDAKQNEETRLIKRKERNSFSEIILIIEDDPDMRLFLQSTLSAFELIVASNGIEGVKLAKHHIPDLILSDVMMPELDGFGVVEQLTNCVATQHIPIILLTAKSNRVSRIKGLSSGAVDYLSKPFDSKELVLRISNLISNRERIRETYRQLLLPGKHSNEVVEDQDRAFIDQCMTLMENHYVEDGLSTQWLSSELHLSERQFQRKLKALFKLTPTQWIKSFRLKKAAEKLMAGATVTVACFESGFTDTAHFSKTFKQAFECSPSEYKQRSLMGE